MNRLPPFDRTFPFPSTKSFSYHQSQTLCASYHSSTPSHHLANGRGTAAPAFPNSDDRSTVNFIPINEYSFSVQPFCSASGDTYWTSTYTRSSAGGNLGPPSRVPYYSHPPAHSEYSEQQQPMWPQSSLPAITDTVHGRAPSPNECLPFVRNLHSVFENGHFIRMQNPPPHRSHYRRSPANERPFKCDQCPQSFNRNHDLKRHKSIHLPVKPHWCVYCNRKFSRKDALRVSDGR